MTLETRLKTCVIKTEEYLEGLFLEDMEEFKKNGADSSIAWTLDWLVGEIKKERLIKCYKEGKKEELKRVMFEFYVDWLDLCGSVAEEFKVEPENMVTGIILGRGSPFLFACNENKVYNKILNKRIRREA